MTLMCIMSVSSKSVYLLCKAEMLQQKGEELLLFLGQMLPECCVDLLNFAL